MEESSEVLLLWVFEILVLWLQNGDDELERNLYRVVFLLCLWLQELLVMWGWL